MKLRIEYFDHNERFAALLPREGAVVSTPTCADSPLRWHLVCLDDPLVYDAIEYTQILVASRWQDRAVGAREATSVFILLVPPSLTVADGFSHKLFLHAAWGMAHVVDAQ